MSLLYMVVASFVIVLLLFIPLFPFWKVWARIKSHHPDLWQEKGPFDARTMMAYPNVCKNFLAIVSLADRDETLMKRDPELIKWTRFAREVWKMAPKSFIRQIIYFLIFLYFVGFFTSLILGLFGQS